MKSVVVVLTARASYARVRSVLESLQKRAPVEVICVASAADDRYGLVVEDIKRDVPWLTVHVERTLVDGSMALTMAETTSCLARLLPRLDRTIEVGCVVTVADRHETLATAVAASYGGFPLCHIQGGEVSGNIDDRVRHTLTQLSDVHCTSTELSTERVRHMLLPHRNTFIVQTGCPSIDLASRVMKMRPEVPFLNSIGVGAKLDRKQPYVVVLQHGVTTHASTAGHEVAKTLDAVYATKKQAIVLTPNADEGSDRTLAAIRQWREDRPDALFRYVTHLPAMDFYRLLRTSVCLAGNSSTGVRECGALGVPSINIGDRQQGRECYASTMHVPHGMEERVTEIIHEFYARDVHAVTGLYGHGDAGEKVADVVLKVAEYGLEWAQ